MKRDFTYVDDVVEGVIRTLQKPPADRREKNNEASPLYSIYNIGNNQPVELMRLIRVIEEKTGKKAILNMLPMQPGDVPLTYADIDALSNRTGYRPYTPIEEGVGRFVDWYREYYKV